MPSTTASWHYRKNTGIKIKIKWVLGHKGVEEMKRQMNKWKKWSWKAVASQTNYRGHSGKSYHTASILLQLRTGHRPLAKHLHCIRKLDSPICLTCQQTEETIQHFILHCPAYNAARQTLQNNTGGRNINITKLLTMPKTLCTLFTYIMETRRWHNTLGEIPTLEED